MVARDVDRLRPIFHPAAVLRGHWSGEPVAVPVERWLEVLAGDPRPAADHDPTARPRGMAGRDWRIETVDVTGNAAVVKVLDLYLGMWFTDHLTLVSQDGHWLIVNKAFHYETTTT